MLEFIQNQSARIPIRMLTPAGSPVAGIAAGSVTVSIEKADGTTVDVVVDGVTNQWLEVTAGAFAGQGKYVLILDAAYMNVLGPFVVSLVAPAGSAMGLVHVVAMSIGQIPAAVWDEPLSGHTIVGSAGESLGAMDSAPPNVQDFSPAPGTPITTNSILSFDVMTLQNVLIFVSYGTTTGAELIFDGSVFRYPYATSSSKLGIAGGMHFTIKRDGGWAATPTIEVYNIFAA